MAAKVRVQKRLYYKIGEACKALGIQPYVLRYWETEFPALAPSKSRSGQRVYSQKELEIIGRIKELLYEEGYTIAGAKKKLETELASGPLAEETEGDDQPGTEKVAEEAAPPAPRSAAPAAAAAQRRPRPQPVKAAPAVEAAAEAAPAAPAVDAVATPEPTDEAERLEKLRSGVAKALREARDLLALLDAKAS